MKRKIGFIFAGLVFFILSGFITIQQLTSPSLKPENFSKTPLSDETRIAILLADLRKSIRNGDTELFDQIIDDAFEDLSSGKRHPRSELKIQLRNATKKMKVTRHKEDMVTVTDADDDYYRRAVESPSLSEISNFDLELTSLNIEGDNAAIDCQFQFLGMDSPKSEQVKIRCNKVDNRWKVMGSDRLMDFIQKL